MRNMPKVVFFPEADPLYINAFVELPVGSDIGSTDKLMKEFGKTLRDISKLMGHSPKTHNKYYGIWTDNQDLIETFEKIME